MSNRKTFGLLLVSASIALFVWTLYDASNVVATLKLGGVLSEASIALIALAIAAIGGAVGGKLSIGRGASRS
jgi:hypothetical protein